MTAPGEHDELDRYAATITQNESFKKSLFYEPTIVLSDCAFTDSAERAGTVISWRPLRAHIHGTTERALRQLAPRKVAKTRWGMKPE